VARENAGVHLYSDYATVLLFAFSVCWKLAKGKITKKSNTATIITPVVKKGVYGWLEREGIEKAKEVIIFKRVSKDFLTQEGNVHETKWPIGVTLTHEDWKPETGECGEGKYHGCSRPYFCDEFRNTSGDRYVAIKVAIKDMHAWESASYPHKIAFRKGTVMYECDRFGKKV
jgi:hypothetical protein